MQHLAAIFPGLKDMLFSFFFFIFLFSTIMFMDRRWSGESGNVLKR